MLDLLKEKGEERRSRSLVLVLFLFFVWLVG